MRLLIALLFTTVAGTYTRAADVAFMAVFKNQSFEQQNPFISALRDAHHNDTNDLALSFGVFIAAAGSNTVTAASFNHPGASGVPIPNDGDTSFDFERKFEFLPALDTAFASGDYTINVTGATDGTRAVTVTLTGDTYPTTPRLRNWTEAQSVDAAQSFTLMWDAMVNGTANDIIMVEVRQESQQGENTVFESPGPGAPGQLNGTSTSFTIPAATLAAGTQYSVVLRFIKMVDSDASYASTLAGYMKETTLPLNTIGGTDTQAPMLEGSRPPTGTSNVKDISSIVFRFSEPMDTAVDPAQAITWTGVTPASFSYLWSNDARELFCRYSPSLPLNTPITWTLNPDSSAAKLRDTAGNNHPNNFYGELNTASGSNVGEPDVEMISLVKAQGFMQTNDTPVNLHIYSAELEVELNGFGTVTNATIAGPFGGPTGYPTEFNGDTMSVELAYASLADLDAFIPSASSYTNDFGGFQDGQQRIVLDFPADNYPSTPTVLNFSTLATADPAADLTLSWTPMSNPGTDDFIFLEIENQWGRTLFESPLPGEPGALNGSATQVVIPAGTLPPGRTLEAQLNFVKTAEKDTTSYPNVTALAAFVKRTEFQITTTGSPIVPSIENFNYTSGQVTFRVRGEYRGTYSLDASMTISNFNYVFTGNTETQGTNGTGTFEFSQPNGANSQFYRAFEGYPQPTQGNQGSQGGQP